MLVLQVQIHVKPECLDAFLAATLENARNSVLEPGVLRFDVMQQEADPTRILLIEVYRDLDAPARHKETTHYLAWRDAVTDMMASPRLGTRFHTLFPDEGGW